MNSSATAPKSASVFCAALSIGMIAKRTSRRNRFINRLRRDVNEWVDRCQKFRPERHSRRYAQPVQWTRYRSFEQKWGPYRRHTDGGHPGGEGRNFGGRSDFEN